MSAKEFAELISEAVNAWRQGGLKEGAGVEGEGGNVVPGSSAVDERLVAFHAPGSLDSEYFRYLQVKVVQALQREAGKTGAPGRILMVTGASRGSGKTLCALNLSLSLARSYRGAVLYLDADCRSTASQRYLGMGDKALPGLTDIMLMRARAGQLLRNTGMSSLLYLPSGGYSAGFLDNLNGEVLSDLLRSLRERFSYVVVDTPPAFPMPEAGILGPHCDGAVVVLRSGRDGEDGLRQVRESLGDTRLLALVLNRMKKVPVPRSGYFGYYGSYGYGRR